MIVLCFSRLCCWFISAGDARMATGSSDVPGQSHTPGQPGVRGGQGDVMTGVLDDFGKCQSQMVCQDGYDCHSTHV